MLKNRIIPCLDVKNGRVVKGINFVDLVDAGDPVEQAKIYDEQGADELCFLDITASNENRNIILDTVKKTAEKCFMPLTVGGGVRTLEDIRNLLLAVADKVSIDTAAVNIINLVKESVEERFDGPSYRGRPTTVRSGVAMSDDSLDRMRIMMRNISKFEGVDVLADEISNALSNSEIRELKSLL